LAGTRRRGTQECSQLPAIEKWMAGDQAKCLLDLAAVSPMCSSPAAVWFRVGDHSSMQCSLARAPGDLLKERLPGRHSCRRTGGDGDTHHQQRFVKLVHIGCLSQLNEPTQDRPVASHRQGAEVR
jgi:hypothetical protein